jgi:hypothetical protein
MLRGKLFLLFRTPDSRDVLLAVTLKAPHQPLESTFSSICIWMAAVFDSEMNSASHKDDSQTHLLPENWLPRKIAATKSHSQSMFLHLASGIQLASVSYCGCVLNGCVLKA